MAHRRKDKTAKQYHKLVRDHIPEIIRQCPDISKITIQRTLTDLQKGGEILKLSGGRYTAYIWDREKE